MMRVPEMEVTARMKRRKIVSFKEVKKLQSFPTNPSLFFKPTSYPKALLTNNFSNYTLQPPAQHSPSLPHSTTPFKPTAWPGRVARNHYPHYLLHKLIEEYL